jgi:hypothetical protein
VEILLRWSDSAHSSQGYECNLAWDGAYVQIGRWNGPYGNFTTLFDSLVSGGAPGSVHDGDVFSADMIGSNITVRLNGRVIATASDSVWTTGNPGIGFYRWNHGGSTNAMSSATSVTQ